MYGMGLGVRVRDGDRDMNPPSLCHILGIKPSRRRYVTSSEEWGGGGGRAHVLYLLR